MGVTPSEATDLLKSYCKVVTSEPPCVTEVGSITRIGGEELDKLEDRVRAVGLLASYVTGWSVAEGDADWAAGVIKDFVEGQENLPSATI